MIPKIIGFIFGLLPMGIYWLVKRVVVAGL